MLGYVIENTPSQLDQREKVQSITRWLNITVESRFYSMWDNAVPMRIRCTIGGPTLHHFQLCRLALRYTIKNPKSF
jgi:hypothetical protein